MDVEGTYWCHFIATPPVMQNNRASFGFPYHLECKAMNNVKTRTGQVCFFSTVFWFFARLNLGPGWKDVGDFEKLTKQPGLNPEEEYKLKSQTKLIVLHPFILHRWCSDYTGKIDTRIHFFLHENAATQTQEYDTQPP